MAKGNTKFTTRVNGAVDILFDDADLDLLKPKSNCLFTPVLREGKYEWIKLMDSDGTLIASRIVTSGEGGDPDNEVEITIGVIIQSEDATSLTKPNPFGKAAIGHARNGVWVDIKGEGRFRLDRVFIVMLLPKGAAPSQARNFERARRNVRNAADVMPDCEVLEVPRGISSNELAKQLKKRVRPKFKGKGRPKGT